MVCIAINVNISGALSMDALVIRLRASLSNLLYEKSCGGALDSR